MQDAVCRDHRPLGSFDICCEAATLDPMHRNILITPDNDSLCGIVSITRKRGPKRVAYLLTLLHAH